MRYAEKRMLEIAAAQPQGETVQKRPPFKGFGPNKRPSSPPTPEERRAWYRAYNSVYRKTRGGKAMMARSNLKATHGITTDAYERLFEEQRGRCAICRCQITRAYDPTRESSGRRGPPVGCAHIDHNHACCPGRRSCGRCIRGLMCGSCNRGLQAFKDNPTLLRSAADYIGRER